MDLHSLGMGKLIYENAKYQSDDTPLDPDVNCPASNLYSKLFESSDQL